MWVNRCACCRRRRASGASHSATDFRSAIMGTAASFGFVGYYLAAELPPLFAGTLLFLTPMSFLMSTARNARQMVDRLALVVRARARPAADLSARAARPDVDRRGRRHARLCHSPPARGGDDERGAARAVALSAAVAGRLPAERGLARARPAAGAGPERGFRDRGVVARGGDRDPRRRHRQADPVFQPARWRIFRFSCG